MKTIICKFKSEGKDIRKTAIINDSFDSLSNSKKNDATDIGSYDDKLIICFQETENLVYEVEFVYENYTALSRLMKPLKAITWNNDSIIDVQKVSVTIR